LVERTYALEKDWNMLEKMDMADEKERERRRDKFTKGMQLS